MFPGVAWEIPVSLKHLGLDANDSGSNAPCLTRLYPKLLISQQDRTLTDISGTVDLLRQQAKVMGQEVAEQNV
jgi:hypothetical protein